jgi:hypothetical protein
MDYGYDDVDLIHLAKDTVHWCAPMNTTINSLVLEKAENYSTI